RAVDGRESGKVALGRADHGRVRCWGLGDESLRIGGTMPATMNAANEIAVEAFLNGGIRFTNIAEIIRSTMDGHTTKDIETLEDALAADRWAREKAESVVVALAR